MREDAELQALTCERKKNAFRLEAQSSWVRQQSVTRPIHLLLLTALPLTPLLLCSAHRETSIHLLYACILLATRKCKKCRVSRNKANERRDKWNNTGITNKPFMLSDIQISHPLGIHVVSLRGPSISSKSTGLCVSLPQFWETTSAKHPAM